MSDVKVERLLINYKTLEDFKSFQEYGAQELSMHEDIENNLVENDRDSPYYGIYYGAILDDRMSLYKRSANFDNYLYPPQYYVVLWKIVVLLAYICYHYCSLCVDY